MNYLLDTNGCIALMAPATNLVQKRFARACHKVTGSLCLQSLRSNCGMECSRAPAGRKTQGGVKRSLPVQLKCSPFRMPTQGQQESCGPGLNLSGSRSEPTIC